MKVDSLDELKHAFESWRRAKKHIREPVPTKLLARARRCSKRYGVAKVVRATRVERSRLFRARTVDRGAREPRPQKSEGIDVSALTFSRFEVSAPAAQTEPIVEVEAGSGVKLRLFQQTPELMDLLHTVCVSGGAR